jgi:hypothetical protein
MKSLKFLKPTACCKLDRDQPRAELNPSIISTDAEFQSQATDLTDENHKSFESGCHWNANSTK